MSRTIDYFLSLNSPWAYLGHERFTALADATGWSVRLLPTDLGRVFPVSGGLPLAKRAPQRQAYRLVELARFGKYLNIPINLQPAFFPVNADAASRLAIAIDEADGTRAAMKFTGAVLRAVWAQERNVADEQVLAQLLAECGLPAERLARSREGGVQARYDANTQLAIDAGVFGAPSFVVDGELFWGQDRLDFLERRLRA